jgi:MarR family transcriptional regulator for hemolysin
MREIEMEEQIEVALKGQDFKHVIDKQFDSMKKKYNLKKVELEVLFYLAKCDKNNTPTDVTLHLNLNRGHVSQAIDTLLKRNLIAASVDEKDRRIMHYAITAYAGDIIDEVGAVKEQLEQQILEGITEKELAEYKRISEKMLANIRKLL